MEILREIEFEKFETINKSNWYLTSLFNRCLDSKVISLKGYLWLMKQI